MCCCTQGANAWRPFPVHHTRGDLRAACLQLVQRSVRAMLQQHSAPATPPTAALVGDMFPVAAAQELAAARAAARRHGCPTRAALHALALHSGDAKLAGAWLQRRQYVIRQAVPLACLSGRVSVSTPQGLVVRLFTLKLHGTWAAVRGVLEWQQHQPRGHQQQQYRLLRHLQRRLLSTIRVRKYIIRMRILPCWCRLCP